MNFNRGDRVKLTEQAAQRAMQGYYGSLKRKRVDWINRRGTVCHNNKAMSGCVAIMWDDRMTYDAWPKQAIELVT